MSGENSRKVGRMSRVEGIGSLDYNNFLKLHCCIRYSGLVASYFWMVKGDGYSFQRSTSMRPSFVA